MDEMNNVVTEIAETTEVVKPAIPYKKVGIGATIVGTILLGGALLAKFVVKPIVEKRRQEKELKEIDEAIENLYTDEEPIQPEYAPDED